MSVASGASGVVEESNVAQESVFESLPNEVLYQMCQQMETPELLNMAEAYARLNAVCSDIIAERKREYPKLKAEKKYKRKVERMQNQLESGRNLRLSTEIPEFRIFTEIQRPPNASGPNMMKQTFYGPIDKKDFVPWPLDNVPFRYSSATTREASFPTGSVHMGTLAKNLVDQDYDIIYY